MKHTIAEVQMMLGEGEDLEEFCYRACRRVLTLERDTAIDLANQLFSTRYAYLDRKCTAGEYRRTLADTINQALAITGPLLPSTEYVGYF